MNNFDIINQSASIDGSINLLLALPTELKARATLTDPFYGLPLTVSFSLSRCFSLTLFSPFGSLALLSGCWAVSSVSISTKLKMQHDLNCCRCQLSDKSDNNSDRAQHASVGRTKMYLIDTCLWHNNVRLLCSAAVVVVAVVVVAAASMSLQLPLRLSSWHVFGWTTWKCSRTAYPNIYIYTYLYKYIHIRMYIYI